MPTAPELTRKQRQSYIEGARPRTVRLKVTPANQNEREQLINRAR